MEMEGSQEIDLEVEDDRLIDNRAASTEREFDRYLGVDENDHLPKLHESVEPAQNQRNGRYNLRKSLAWDSAFFTSAGVLDPEELSSMIIRPDKREKHCLPGIQEDIAGSTESISTFESDNLTRETFEDDLFVDIRASIQRSSKKAMDLANSSSKPAIEVDNTGVSSLRNEGVDTENKLMQNPKPGLKKSGGVQTVRMSKPQTTQNVGKLGSAKATKIDGCNSQMSSISKIGAANSLHPRPPKITSSSIPSSATAKRESTGTGRVKSECGSSKLGVSATSKGTQPPKVSILSGARRVLPKPVVSSKSSLSSSLSTSGVQSMRSSTSSDCSSTNTSSKTPAKSTLAMARRNPGKSGNAGTGPSGSIPRTPSKAALKNKPPPSTLSARMTSIKIPSNVSPASSISEWSSASSTSSIVLNQRSSSPRISLDTSSRRSTDSYTTGRHDNQGTNLTTSNARKSSTQTSTLQVPVKPSGLRMPSPKIGFFDGAKSSGNTPDGQHQSQSGLRTPLSKNGAATCSPKQSSNTKVKSARVQTPRTGSSLARTSSQEISPGVKLSAIGQSCPNAEKVPDAGTVIKEDSDVLNMHKNVSNNPSAETVDDINALDNENHLKTKSPPICDATDKENSRVNYQGEHEVIDQIDDENHLKTKSPPICEATDKENSLVNYQGEMLTGVSRDPLAPKNISCSNESVDVTSKESAIDVAVVEKPGLVLPSLEQKEIS